MVHSIELVFDGVTEAAIRRIWADLAAAGIPSQAPASRPHLTLAVADVPLLALWCHATHDSA